MSLSRETSPAWRPMTTDDLGAVFRLSEVVHPELPEDEAVFRDRLSIHPPGCLVLGVEAGIGGYAVSHPWRMGPAPRLNRRLEELPPAPDTYYIHDLALAPPWRGRGLADAGVETLLREAALYPSACLVSVYGTPRFWSRFGFADRSDMLAAGSLSAYGSGARFMVRPTPR